MILSLLTSGLFFNSLPSSQALAFNKTTVQSYYVDLSKLFNNIAVGPNANFDPREERWDADFMPRGDLYVDGITYHLPQKWTGEADNLVVHGQTINIPQSVQYAREMNILYAGDYDDGENNAVFTFNFADGTQQQVEASIHNWWNLHWINSGAAVKMPHHLHQDGTINYNQTQMLTWSTSISTTSALTSITLPNGYDDRNRLHIFAMTLVDSQTTDGINLGFRQARLTTRWRMFDAVKAYAVEVTLASFSPMSADPAKWINSPWSVTLNSSVAHTVQPGEFRRLMPGDQLLLDIWISSSTGVNNSHLFTSLNTSFAHTPVYLSASGGGGFQPVTQEVMLQLESDPLLRDTPEWYGNAKFGIFMHWGIFSVPGWGPPNTYAEWYWWWQHNPMDDTNFWWLHHKLNYGEKFVYDDFIPEFAKDFSADAITDIVASSGAKYFVPVTMHHDGFAIFDTGDATHRSSVYLGPKRDFLMELFESARSRHPDLVLGTYFSLPEWFNPDMGKGGYGFGKWYGELAVNAYDNTTYEPYTGRLPVGDWVHDVQFPKMKALAEKYKTQLMWCDIGGPNLTRTFVEEWWSFVDENNMQVAMNDRCGALPQFDTPEYAKFASIQTQKWESSESVDPASYGYNRITKDSDYRTPQYIITSLVDIVSKNGNYLLNIGPTGDGVVPAIVAQNLKGVGDWLNDSGPCIFDTNYFYFGAQDAKAAYRFTRTNSTFCVIALGRPSKELVVVDTPVPLLASDTVALLGAGDAGTNLTWTRQTNGSIAIQVPNAVVDSVENAWAFQFTYN
ncbi:glycoside hydrolase family 29 protein [Clavulina sp. PMI_390]|nr:glycoside hydrolase family 29 protein [Clavulina sp. PMI_390]